MSDEHDAVEAVGPDRRTFVKGLIATTVFAAPLVSTFTMSGVQSVFGATPRSTTIGGNANCTTAAPPAPDGFPDLVDSFIYLGGDTTQSVDDSGVDVSVHVPPGALPACTVVSIFRADLAALAGSVPAGETPLNGYAVVWNSPDFIGTGGEVEGTATPDATSPLTLTVTNAPVLAGDPVYVFDKTSGAAVPDTVATNGTWTTTFTVDPGYVVTRVPAAAAPAVVADANFTG